MQHNVNISALDAHSVIEISSVVLESEPAENSEVIRLETPHSTEKSNAKYSKE